MNKIHEHLNYILPKTIEDFHLESLNEESTSSVMSLLTTLVNMWCKDNVNSESLVLCEGLLDHTWEELNTGHWKDVDLKYRYLYSYSSLLKLCFICKLDENSSINEGCQKLLLICDMGLLMGAPILDNVLGLIANSIVHYYNENSDSENIKSINNSVKDKNENFEKRKKPFSLLIERVLW